MSGPSSIYSSCRLFAVIIGEYCLSFRQSWLYSDIQKVRCLGSLRKETLKMSLTAWRIVKEDLFSLISFRFFRSFRHTEHTKFLSFWSYFNFLKHKYYILISVLFCWLWLVRNAIFQSVGTSGCRKQKWGPTKPRLKFFPGKIYEENGCLNWQFWLPLPS